MPFVIKVWPPKPNQEGKGSGAQQPPCYLHPLPDEPIWFVSDAAKATQYPSQPLAQGAINTILQAFPDHYNLYRWEIMPCPPTVVA